jgi:hypothetical protein
MLEKKAARLAAQSDEVDSEAEPEQDSGIEGCIPQSDSRFFFFLALLLLRR